MVLLVAIALVEFVNAKGTSPFATWRAALDSTTRARVTIAVFRLEAGNFSAAKGVGFGVLEIRLDFGPGYWVYFGKDGDELVILLGGGTKKRQQADIVAAQSLWQEYKSSKRREGIDGKLKKF